LHGHAQFILFLIALISVTAVLHGASTPFIQNVRFAQEISATDLVVPPHVLTHPAAVYTDEARRRGIQGNVIVQAYFDARGNITVLKVVKGLGYGLDENALAILKDWRFAPALRNGLPVSAVAEIEVPFTLPGKWVVQVVNGRDIVVRNNTDPQGRIIDSIWESK
jgi:TonB family protein